MTLARVHTRALQGVNGVPVEVEVYLAPGLPAFNLVGLPETVVKESRDRVRAAILTSQFDFPMRRITVSLAPADIPKDGGRFDLPIALGILAASEQIPDDEFDQWEFIGELALSGQLRPISGALPTAWATQRANRGLIAPTQSANQAALIKEITTLQADSLLDVCLHLRKVKALRPASPCIDLSSPCNYPDLDEVKGQQRAKRALEVSASGQHHILLMGPPGTGKSMLASRLPGILPPMSETEALEAAAVASVSQSGFNIQQWKQRPFRHPHHTASGVALVGGGSLPKPGEISLAHSGVLFLDELPEFPRHVLDVLREPIETGSISIARATQQAEFPCRFLLVAAANPCICGYYGDDTIACRCSADAVRRYQSKISGPFLDRIDLQIDVPRIDPRTLRESPRGESSAVVRDRVCASRERQLARQQIPNAFLKGRALEQHCSLDTSSSQLLDMAINKLGLSARAYDRVLRLSRTLADLEQQPAILERHIAEAISFRQLDRIL